MCVKMIKTLSIDEKVRTILVADEEEIIRKHLAEMISLELENLKLDNNYTFITAEN